MTTSLKSDAGAFTNNIVPAKPTALASAEMFLLLGGTEALSTADRNGGTAATVVGTPVYDDGFCTLNGSNGFQSAASAAGQPFTYAAVFSLAATNDTVVYCGNWTASTPRHALSSANASRDMRLGVDGGTRVTDSGIPDGMNFIAGSHDGSTARLYVGADGALTKTEAAFSGGSQTSVFRAGGNGTGGTNAFNMAAVAYWQSQVSDADLLAVYEYLIAGLAMRGVTVL